MKHDEQHPTAASPRAVGRLPALSPPTRPPTLPDFNTRVRPHLDRHRPHRATARRRITPCVARRKVPNSPRARRRGSGWLPGVRSISTLCAASTVVGQTAMHACRGADMRRVFSESIAIALRVATNNPCDRPFPWNRARGHRIEGCLPLHCAGGCPFGGDGSVDAPLASANSSRSRTTPAGVPCFSGSASSAAAWWG